MAATLLSGLVFGAALTASGVYHPSAIIGQLRLADWHMLETFLSATASSTFLISAFHATGLVKLSPRCYSPLGLFACYDGNIVGGILLGTGMALAGSCPGTVLAQVGAGTSSGLPALAGGLLAGVVWAGFLRSRLRSCTPPQSPDEKALPLTVHHSFGISETAATVTFTALLAVTVVAINSMGKSGPAARVVVPVAGGLLIGAAQLVSLLLRRTAIGVSTVYEEAGDLMYWLLGVKAREGRPKVTSLIFGAGIIAGAWALRAVLPAVADAPELVSIPAVQAVLGGFLMVMGARVAGGCTSGHGITGMSLLSVSSFVTIGSALAAGVATARMLLPGV